MIRERAAGRAVTVGCAFLALLLAAVAMTWDPRPAPDLLLVADLRGRALLVVDPARPQDARRIELPGGPHELLPLPDGRVLVSLEQSGVLAAVDLESGGVESFEVGGVPHGLALDGQTVLVTDREADQVRRFELDPWGELGPLAAGRWPHAVGVTPSGAVAVANAASGTLAVDGVHAPVGRITETLAVRADGAIASAAATDGVVVLHASDGRELQRWQVGGRPVRVAFSPDGTVLAVALSAAHAVVLISTEGVTTAPVEGVPDGLAFSTDGGLLYVSDVVGGAVTVLDVATGRPQAVLAVGQATGALMVLAP